MSQNFATHASKTLRLLDEKKLGRNVLLANGAKLCDDVGMSIDLDVDIRSRLDKRRGDWKAIATQADVSHSWISQFVRGLIPNPGFATLKKLRAALAADAGAEARDAA